MWVLISILAVLVVGFGFAWRFDRKHKGTRIMGESERPVDTLAEQARAERVNRGNLNNLNGM